jgi:hypothetical protein
MRVSESVFSPPASLETQRAQRRISFFIAAERTAMKNHTAAEAAVTKTHAKKYIEFGRRFELSHPPHEDGFCFSASQR